MGGGGMNLSFGPTSFTAQIFSYQDLVFHGLFLPWFPRASMTNCHSEVSAEMLCFTVLEAGS